jgi:uncharacterized membrane protein
MRLQETHPALVHFPIAFLPATLAIDAIGRVTDEEALLTVGRVGMVVTAASAAISGIFGLIAQEASRFDPEAHDVLVTHRNLNLGLIAATGLMAVQRLKRREPSVAYLLGGLVGMGVMSYSAYLGGHMVYEHGVGVKRGGGLAPDRAPHLEPQQAGEVVRVAGSNVADGVRHTVSDLARGEFLPWLSDRSDTEAGPEAPTISSG